MQLSEKHIESQKYGILKEEIVDILVIRSPMYVSVMWHQLNQIVD